MNEYYNIAQTYFRGTISAADEKRLSEWLRTEANKQQFDEWAAEWRKHAKAEASERTKAAWGKLVESLEFSVERSEKKESPIRLASTTTRRTYAWLRYAASVAVVAVIGALTLWLLQPAQQEPFMAQTGAHERQTITLPDGTEVTMNSLTTLACAENFGKTDRQLTFDGEAVFHVAKDAERPFVIHVGDYSVTVLGTTFNLSAYTTDDTYTVTLLEGAVKVKNSADSVVMQPMDEVRFDRTTATLELQHLQTAKADTWLNGRLEYDNIPLRDLARKLEREYDVQIAFADEQIRHEQVYISISTDERFEDVCAALEDLLPVTITHEENTYFISAR